MYIQTIVLLGIIIAVFAFCSWKLKSAEISMVIAGVAAAVVYGIWSGRSIFPARVLVEGLFTNFDLAITFVTASIFINMYSHTGAMKIVTRKLVSSISNKWLLLSFMAIFMLIPGALTGAGSVSVFVMGGLVATVVRYMGLSDKKTTAFIFMFAILSAACPPINLWTMLMTATANMPYVGFTVPLLVPILIVGAFTIIFLGWGSKPDTKEKILAELPEAEHEMGWIRILLPLVTLVVLFLLSLYLPFSIPVLGMPLMFVLSTVVAILCNPGKMGFKEFYNLVKKTMEQVFPLLATVISVGLLVNVMAMTGVKGLIAVTFVTLPIAWIYVVAMFFLPFTQGALSYGSAIIVATPVIFLFNAHGLDTTIVAAGLSIILPIGDCLPPSRIVGRISCETAGYKGSYMSFLKQILIPCLLLAVLGLMMLMFPNQLSFLK